MQDATPSPMLPRLAVLAAVASLAALGLAGYAVLRQPPAPTELALQRLEIVEPDGTPRLVIASRARFPGMYVRGKEIARPDRADTAGIIFVNDEGTENGGLIQSGKLDAKGQVSAGLSLTFDRFRQDQVLQLLHTEDGSDVSTGVIINDRPSHTAFSIEDMAKLMDLPPAQREAAFSKHEAAGHFGASRAFFGTEQGTAELVLRDPKGNPRLRLAVDATGAPALELLDAAGTVVKTFR